MPVDIFVNGIQLGIIRHDELAVGGLDLHPNVLPDLYSYCALRKILIDLLDGIRAECRVIETVRVEGRTKSNMTVTGADQLKRIGYLWLKALAVGECVIHHQNI